jgi:hypothetical protein
VRPDRQALQSSALWHLHDFDASRGTARLLQLEEADYFAESFLDQRVEPLAVAECEIPLVELQAALLQNESRHPGPDPGSTESMSPRNEDRTGPVHGYIFHLGHCGSTLLSRALSASPNLLPVREPLTLRRLAAEPGSIHLLPVTLAAHARVFHPGQAAVIKATSTCNALIEPVLAGDEQSRAVLMMVKLEAYLAGLLGKLTPATDLRTQANLRLADWNDLEDAPALDPNTMDEAHLAVLSWLTSMRHLLHSSQRCPRRTLLLDFEEFLAQPEAALIRCATFLGIEPELPTLLGEWPTIAMGYSKKPDEPYSAFNRHKTLQRGRMTRGAEIHQGLEWARKLTAEIEGVSGCADYLETSTPSRPVPPEL